MSDCGDITLHFGMDFASPFGKFTKKDENATVIMVRCKWYAGASNCFGY